MKEKTLILGASIREDRYSNRAIKSLVNHEEPTVALGLKKGEVSGVTIETEMVDYEAIDTISLYLNPKRQEDYYQYIIDLNPNRVIFNPGTENKEFQELLRHHNIAFEESCTLVLLATGQY